MWGGVGGGASGAIWLSREANRPSISRSRGWLAGWLAGCWLDSTCVLISDFQIFSRSAEYSFCMQIPTPAAEILFLLYFNYEGVRPSSALPAHHGRGKPPCTHDGVPRPARGRRCDLRWRGRGSAGASWQMCGDHRLHDWHGFLYVTQCSANAVRCGGALTLRVVTCAQMRPKPPFRKVSRVFCC
jgi:hypothetical protein